MQLLVIRHAIAVDRDETKVPDAERALTAKGEKRMKKAAAALKELVPSLDLIATSALTRARQTAAIVSRHYSIEPHVIGELAPGAPLGRLLEWVAAQAANQLAIVGHEDGLSTFVSWLISARPESHLMLKKGGACLVKLPGKIEPGAATLEWLLTPKQLRQLA
jgi:phosphohistidine phosphatase